MSKEPNKQQDNKNIEQFNKFLSNNEQLLQEKYKEYFIKDTFKISVNNPSPQTVVKYISDVFSFDKHSSKADQSSEEKEMSEKIQSSLKDSYKQFLKQNSSTKDFNYKVAVDLIKFCIVNNQLFAVQYETSTQPDKQGDSPTKSNHEAREHNSLEADQNNKDSGSQAMQNRSQMSNQFAEHGRIHEGASNFDMSNQFNFHQEIKPDFDPLIIKKNTKVVFDYYCKQQMSLAPNMSFDRIGRESSHLTMNKFIMMATLMNMINTIITKDLLIRMFRKISQGKREIDFKKFEILLSQLKIQDPTLVARSQLSNQNIHLYLKTNKKPFDTQDMMPRELVKNRSFHKKLTAHSGKMQEDLLADLKAKRASLLEDASAQSKIRYMYNIVSDTRIRNSSPLQKSQSRDLALDHFRKEQYLNINQKSSRLSRGAEDIVSTKKLLQNNKMQARNYSHDLNLISKIIPASNDDDKWLGEYKIQLPARKGARSSIKYSESSSDNSRRSFDEKQIRNALLIQDLKNRIREIERTEHEGNSFEETKPYLGSSRRY